MEWDWDMCVKRICVLVASLPLSYLDMVGWGESSKYLLNEGAI